MDNAVERKFSLEQFRAISHAISTYDDLELLLTHITEGVARSFKIKGCCIHVLDEKENQLFMVSSYGISREYLEKGPIFIDEKDSALVKGEPVFIEDIQTDARVQYPKQAADENIASMLSIPIKYRGTVTGVLRMYHHEALAINAQDLESLSVLLEHLGVVIENNGLKNVIDQLKVVMDNLPPRVFS
ncbi:GAF domain-containing protein [uncultured Desulfobacter sp.]|uniref:GAF domain-containing protein n=1 Tax=uncultured Desulfobacter sp. TaxID=240139 RepID=UPI002AAA641E|nr:GAF domain-containing protein [uncultured Desulfobacter sp.]